MQQIKFILKHIVYFLLHILWIFPMNRRKIYFTSFHGARFSCNTKYLYLYIKETFPEKFLYVWEFIDHGKNVMAKADRTVRPSSLKAVIEAMTSAVIITNNDFSWWIPLRKNQILLQTWHGGGAYKKVGRDEKWGDVFQQEQSLMADRIGFYVSSCRKFTEVQSESKGVPQGKFITTGMPRNAVFFDPARCETLSRNARTALFVQQSAKIILYAPTFRGTPVWKNDDTRDYGKIDFLKAKQVCNEKFGGEFVVLYRAHHVDSNLKNSLPDFVIDATKYEDMQELLCAADVLVTDYSSSMWDFALTGKPCFLYAPDIDKYIAERGFYTAPATWPFPLARNEDALHENISRFDGEKYAAAVRKHLEDLGSYENKDACRKVCEAIGIFNDNSNALCRSGGKENAQ